MSASGERRRGGSGEGFKGLWEEASKGSLEVLSAALAPGGGGDVHACMGDGEKWKFVLGGGAGRGGVATKRLSFPVLCFQHVSLYCRGGEIYRDSRFSSCVCDCDCSTYPSTGPS